MVSCVSCQDEALGRLCSAICTARTAFKNHGLVLFVKHWAGRAPKGMDSVGVEKRICRVGSNESQQDFQELKQGWH